MTNQERLQANNAKIEAIQQTLANKVVTSGEIELTENNTTYDVSKYASAKTNIVLGENYRRPEDWLKIPEIQEGVDEIYVLFGVYKGLENNLTIRTYKGSGNAYIDWGDGLIEPIYNGEYNYHSYNYDNLSEDSFTNHNSCKQALVHIYCDTLGSISTVLLNATKKNENEYFSGDDLNPMLEINAQLSNGGVIFAKTIQSTGSRNVSLLERVILNCKYWYSPFSYYCNKLQYLSFNRDIIHYKRNVGNTGKGCFSASNPINLENLNIDWGLFENFDNFAGYVKLPNKLKIFNNVANTAQYMLSNVAIDEIDTLWLPNTPFYTGWFPYNVYKVNNVLSKGQYDRFEFYTNYRLSKLPNMDWSGATYVSMPLFNLLKFIPYNIGASIQSSITLTLSSCKKLDTENLFIAINSLHPNEESRTRKVVLGNNLLPKITNVYVKDTGDLAKYILPTRDTTLDASKKYYILNTDTEEFELQSITEFAEKTFYYEEVTAAWNKYEIDNTIKGGLSNNEMQTILTNIGEYKVGDKYFTTDAGNYLEDRVYVLTDTNGVLSWEEDINLISIIEYTTTIKKWDLA